MRHVLYISLLITIAYQGLCLSIFNHDSASQGILNRLHNRSTNGVLTRNNASSGVLNPETKTAAKAVACATVGKGICLSAAAAKYTTKELTESHTSESMTKHPQTKHSASSTK